MTERISADVIAAALVAAVRVAGLDPRTLLAGDAGARNTALRQARAAACVALLDWFKLPIRQSARLKALCMPSLTPIQRCSDTSPSIYLRAKRFEACHSAAVAAVEAKSKGSGTALVEAVLRAKPLVDCDRAGKAVKGRSKAASAKPISPLDSLSSTKTIEETPLVGEAVTKASPKPLSLDEAKARLARQKSWAPNPVDLPPIPPVVNGTKWTRDYIAERERIKALHRAAGRKVPA